MATPFMPPQRSNISLTEVENGWVINAFVPNPDYKDDGSNGPPSQNQQFVATTTAQATAAVEKAMKAAAGKSA